MKLRKMIATGLVTLTLSGVVLPIFQNNIVHASEETLSHERKLSDSEINKIDKYIIIKNKQYALNPSNDLSNELKHLAEKRISRTNEMIKKYKGTLLINQSSKTMVGFNLLSRDSGKNDVEFHWNYARVYIDAPNIRLLGAGLIGGAAGGIGFAIETFGLSVLAGMITGFVGQKLSEIEDGIWFDYNCTGTITDWGWQ